MRLHIFGLLMVVLLLGACDDPPPPTSISVTGTLVGSSLNTAVTMSHGADLAASPSIEFANGAPGMGRLERLDLSLTRSGVATTTGYELLAILNNFDASGGDGIFMGTATAGNPALFTRNTGTVAKTSYYYFEDSGESTTFAIPPNPGTPMRLMLARVASAEGVFARIPFTETGPVTAGYLSVDCLTGGDAPCFDMTTLIATLHTSLSDAVTASVGGNSGLTLGGPDADGDMRLDYIPATVALRGCADPASQDPAFGFVFGATIDAPLGIRTRIRIPIMFSVLDGGAEVEVRVHPFSDLGGCQEMQFIDAITVNTTSFLGIGAQQIADTVQTNIVCSLFGPTVGDFDCEGITPAPLSEMLTSGLGAMVTNTIIYYWRQAHDDELFPGNMGVLLRPRNADNSLTTTSVTPGDPDAVEIELMVTQ